METEIKLFAIAFIYGIVALGLLITFLREWIYNDLKYAKSVTIKKGIVLLAIATVLAIVFFAI